MVKKLSNSISKILADGGVINKDDEAKCSYGIDIMISSVVQISIVLVASIFIRNFIQTLLFFLMFIPLRIYAGGYHADSRGRCFAILIGVYMFFCIFLQIGNAKIYTITIWGGMVFTLITVLLAAPVLHSRKHLTENEICAFRKIAILVCSAEIILIVIGSMITGQNMYISSCVCGQLAVSLSMVAACIKKRLGGVKNEEVL